MPFFIFFIFYWIYFILISLGTFNYRVLPFAALKINPLICQKYLLKRDSKFNIFFIGKNRYYMEPHLISTLIFNIFNLLIFAATMGLSILLFVLQKEEETAWYKNTAISFICIWALSLLSIMILSIYHYFVSKKTEKKWDNLTLDEQLKIEANLAIEYQAFFDNKYCLCRYFFWVYLKQKGKNKKDLESFGLFSNESKAKEQILLLERKTNDANKNPLQIKVIKIFTKEKVENFPSLVYSLTREWKNKDDKIHCEINFYLAKNDAEKGLKYGRRRPDHIILEEIKTVKVDSFVE